MGFSAISMFASDNVNSSTCIIRRYIYRAYDDKDRHFAQPDCKEHCVGRCVLYVGTT